MEILLSHLEKIRLESQHKMLRDKRECDRLKAILLTAEDWSEEMISQALRTHKSCIHPTFMSILQRKKTNSNHHGLKSLLNSIQTELVIAHSTDVTSSSISDICEYIKTTFSIEYSRS
ncbi:MAG: hypothetical protein KAH18_03285 [Psychromonas sp.]|nr:hypothetical protein [Psychromonas sp.]